MDPALTSRQRGQIVRGLAGREHAGPWGRPVSVSRKTIDRWITARRAGGFDALVPAPRQCTPRTDPQGGDLAGGLEKKKPARTAAQGRGGAGPRQGRGRVGGGGPRGVWGLGG